MKQLVKVSQDCFLISSCDVHALIPSYNKCVYTQHDFKINIVKRHIVSSDVKIATTPIVCAKPHGAKFFTSNPARIWLPLNGKFKTVTNIVCLCSNTSTNEPFRWRMLNTKDYEICGDHIELRTTHFSFFMAIGHQGYPEVSQMIYAEEGGRLEVPGVPGVEVIFPEMAVLYDIAATIKVMFADEPYDVDHKDPTSYALAAPVIKLGPSGYKFNPESLQKVQVRLPLPDAREIIENCDRPYLTFWQSNTAEGQPLEWKLFETPYRIDADNDGFYSVYFTVQHFTFFKVLWSILDNCVNEAKIGASYFFPHFDFCVNLQAFMSVNEDGCTFGLCVVGYRVGEPMESIGNYPIFVGGSGQKRITSGLHRIRIVSKLFVANTDLGEEKLEQQEFFAGRQFDKQFACKYMSPNISDYGTIGKVYFERVKKDGTFEQLFDFLLIKPRPGQELIQNQGSKEEAAENIQTIDQQSSNSTKNELWEAELSKELAALLSIKTDCDLGDSVWQDVALSLGYKPVEIDLKFKNEDDPWSKLLDDYKNRRGASPYDFITAMHKIGRKEKAREFAEKTRLALPDNEPIGEVPCCSNGSLSPSRTSTTSGVVLPPAASNMRKRRHSSEMVNGVPVSSAQLLDVAREKTVQEKWRNIGRSLGVEDNQLSEIERDYENAGILEKTYQMFLAWKERYPENGKDKLVQVLGKWHLNGVARKLYSS